MRRDDQTFFSTCLRLFLHIIKSARPPRGQNTLRAVDAMRVLFLLFLYFKTKGGDGGRVREERRGCKRNERVVVARGGPGGCAVRIRGLELSQASRV